MSSFPAASRRLAGAIAAATVGLGVIAAAPATAQLPGDQDLVAAYPFDEAAGTVVNDRSGHAQNAAIVNGNASTAWNNGRGLILPGGNGSTAPAVQLPDALLSGRDDVT